MSAVSSLPSSTGLSPATAASLNASSSGSAASGVTGNSQTPNFMQLLITQMKNQDPTSPTSATDFVTQMAQLSNVQGINQLNQTIASLVAMQSLTQGISMIGKTVSYTNSAGKTVTGVVGSINMVGGQPQLVVNNANVGMSQVQSIQATPKAKTSGTTATTSTS
jgi:flagellar basal-body rod modification protein FlgD